MPDNPDVADSPDEEGSPQNGGATEAASQAFREVVIDSIAGLYATCREQLDLLGTASDEEVIHDLRVGLRRLRSAVNAFAPYLKLPEEAEARKISKLLRVLGELRDADVMKETLDELESLAGDLGGKDIKLREAAQKSIQAYREGCLASATKVLHGKKAGRLLHAVEEWLEDPRFADEGGEIVGAPARLLAPALLAPHGAAVFLHSAWHIDEIDRKQKLPGEPELEDADDGKAGGDGRDARVLAIEQAMFQEGPSHCMHDLRKKLRELRYQMELLKGIYGSSDRFADALGKVQRLQGLLGRLQDFHVLANFLRAHTKKPAPLLASTLSNLQAQMWDDWLAARDILWSVEGQSKLFRAFLKPQGTGASKKLLKRARKLLGRVPSDGALNEQREAAPA